jgi:hypothetical protein
MNLTVILEISVIGLAVAQVLTILLTFRRERDIKKLRELVDEQKRQIVGLRAWLGGRNAAASQPSRAPEPKPEPAKMPRELLETKSLQPRTPDEEAAQALKVLNWQREIVANLRSTLPLGTNEDELKRANKAIDWLKEEADKVNEIADAPKMVLVSVNGDEPPKRID